MSAQFCHDEKKGWHRPAEDGGQDAAHQPMMHRTPGHPAPPRREPQTPAGLRGSTAGHSESLVFPSCLHKPFAAPCTPVPFAPNPSSPRDGNLASPCLHRAPCGSGCEAHGLPGPGALHSPASPLPPGPPASLDRPQAPWPLCSPWGPARTCARTFRGLRAVTSLRRTPLCNCSPLPYVSPIPSTSRELNASPSSSLCPAHDIPSAQDPAAPRHRAQSPAHPPRSPRPVLQPARADTRLARPFPGTPTRWGPQSKQTQTQGLRPLIPRRCRIWGPCLLLPPAWSSHRRLPGASGLRAWTMLHPWPPRVSSSPTARLRASQPPQSFIIICMHLYERHI